MSLLQLQIKRIKITQAEQIKNGIQNILDEIKRRILCQFLKQ